MSNNRSSTPRGEARQKTAPGPTQPIKVEPAPTIVALLEDLLARAKLGEIQSVGMVRVNPTGEVLYDWRTGPIYGNPQLLLSGVARFQVRLANALEG